MTDTTNTNTSAAHAAALAMRDAAAALARRRPLYDGASGEPADEDLAQAIEDLPLPDVDVTDWKAEAERLRAEPAQAREVLFDCATTLEGYARHHAERGPEHAHKVARNAELAARCRAVLSAKGE